MLPILDFLGPIVTKVLDFIPDPKQKAEAQQKALEELNRHQEEIMKALASVDVEQAKINAVDAVSSDKFKSYARPAALWVCVIGLAWSVFLPVIAWGLKLCGVTVPELPQLSSPILNTLTFSLLGLTAARSYDKMQGTN